MHDPMYDADPEPEPYELKDLVYTVREAAKVLKIRTDKCYALVREGSINATRISSRNIRIPRAELLRFISDGSAQR
jgi:excisionase family DNA binding protein